jgi:uncharacterized protein (DUF952 family)
MPEDGPITLGGHHGAGVSRNTEHEGKGTRVEFRTAEEARTANVTYHLVPVTYWQEHGTAEHYVPAGYDDEGFIHCTNGLDELVKVANLFYTGDPRDFQVMVLDVGKLTPELRYDDPGEVYPHLYGPLNTAAVIGVLPVRRTADGAFVSIGGDE